MSSRLLVAGLLGLLVSVAGCSTKDESETGEPVTSESEVKPWNIHYLGQIANGETRSAYYYAPRYRAFAFEASGGDEITVDVKSKWGDAVTWITDSSYRALAFNDDDLSKFTLDSKVSYVVPADQPTRSYRIVFRDYDELDALFHVTLSIQSPEPPSCVFGDQTLAVDETVDAGDGCNTCICAADGTVSCTEAECQTCDPATEEHRSYLGTPQQCAVIRFTCSPGQVPFSNDCGCGCETAP